MIRLLIAWAIDSHDRRRRRKNAFARAISASVVGTAMGRYGTDEQLQACYEIWHGTKQL